MVGALPVACNASDRSQCDALVDAAWPGEIIGAALHFATDASAYCTGANLALDRGWR